MADFRIKVLKNKSLTTLKSHFRFVSMNYFEIQIFKLCLERQITKS